ncbi:MAG: outer membrane protein assembly factor BamE, partial [Pseudomonadota bacterium]
QKRCANYRPSRPHYPNKMIDRISNPATRLVLLLAIFSVLASGCVYRANISQGNLIKQDDLDQVELGMTKNQVRFLLGTPMIDDPFHSDRWDYVYYLKVGRKDADFRRWVSIQFENNLVADIQRDLELNPGL